MESVRAQRFRDWELLIIDDGSTDGTAEAVERLADARIHYHYQTHQGVSAARNHGLDEARFDWIAFLDSDDRWRPRKLEKQLEALESEPAYGACFTNEIWIRNGVRVNPRARHRKQGGWIFSRCLELCTISPSSILLHRRVLEKTGGFDESFPVCEDYELWLRLCCRYPVLYLHDPLIFKTGGHADQLSRSRWGLDRFRLQALDKILRSKILTPQQEAAAISELIRKARILHHGCRKRGKIEDAKHYAGLMESYR